MTALDYLILSSLGMLIGAAGQGARVVAGLKKMNDEATAKNVHTRELFDTRQLVLSLLIGAIAGLLAAVFSLENISNISKEQILFIATAGYAGSDFIEAFLSKVAPK